MTKVLSILILTSMILISSCSSNKATNPEEEEIQEFVSVYIGNQVWMLKNLDVSHYRNGDEIFHAKTGEEWSFADKQGIGAWCYYENAPGLGEIFGKLYNWYAVNDERGLAPEGWRVPDYWDWKELINYFGKENAGAYLKSTGTELWLDPNLGANNLSGFTALPASGRDYKTGIFFELYKGAIWWASTEAGPQSAWSIQLGFNSTTAQFITYHKGYGFSVRCIRDE